MKIGIDIDDTISDTYEVQFNLAQYYTITMLKREGSIQELDNLQTHFYTKYLHNWTQEEEKQFFDLYYQQMLEKVKPKMFAVEILQTLKKAGHHITLITARFDWDKVDAKQVTQKWLAKYQIPYDALITDAQDKGKLATENRIELFLDDSFHNCKEVANLGIKTYVMDSRVNRRLHHEKVTRVYSWPHFYQKIEEETK